MRQRSWQVLGILVALGAVIALRATPAAQAQNADVLAALLTEVRGLRVAMEQMVSAGPRIQLATARLQLQEQRVSTLARRLEGIRQSLAVHDAETTQKQDALERLEEALKQADVQAREQIAQDVAVLKRELATSPAQAVRLQAEEAQVAQELATEQGRWNEINQGLEELDRALRRK